MDLTKIGSKTENVKNNINVGGSSRNVPIAKKKLARYHHRKSDHSSDIYWRRQRNQHQNAKQLRS
jgi:hypothetical protein